MTGQRLALVLAARPLMTMRESTKGSRSPLAGRLLLLPLFLFIAAPQSLLGQARGTVSAGGGVAAPGLTFDIPITLSLGGDVKVDALAFGLQITPGGGAPALSGSLSFRQVASLPQPLAAPTGSNAISVGWLGNLNPPLSATVALGVVSMTIPSSAQNGQAYTLTITGASGSLGQTSIPLAAGPNATLAVSTTTGPKPLFTAASVTNGASFISGASPGSIVTIFGTGLTRGLVGIAGAAALPLPTELRGTSVTLNKIPAPLFAVANVNGQEQINLQVPYEVAGQSTASIVVSNNGVASDPVQVNLLVAHPGIFTVDGIAGAILHGADFQLATSSNPAAKGEVVVIYATGLGPVSPTPATGMGASASPLSVTASTPSVTVGGLSATVAFSGLAPGFVGLYQVNVAVPSAAASGSVDVVIQIAGQASKAVKLAVQ